MLTMNADRWIFLFALCFISVSSNDDLYYDDNCETLTVSAPLGTSVLLPCNFTTSSLEWVSWTHTGMDLIRLTSKGRTAFLDHRYGRVKAFPNQGSQGNFSICIDELTDSDLGGYRCHRGHECLHVDLVAEGGAVSEDIRLLIYICAGVAAFILLSTAGYCCIKSTLCCKKKTQDNANNPEGAGTGGVAAPSVETGRVPVDQQHRGYGNDELVYENDDQDPSNQHGDPIRNYCVPVQEVQPDPGRTQPAQSTSGIYPNLNQFERTESHRTKLRFSRELFSRLRQASLSRHYYVNQVELQNQQAMSTQPKDHSRAEEKKGKKKAKKNAEYQNPIYNRSTDQLHQL